jgi:hypothetical protein
MKKILAMLSLVASGLSFAGSSATVEFADYTNQVAGGANSKLYSLIVKHDLSNTLAADVGFGNQVTDGTGALSTRLEAGLTATNTIFGSVKGYTRIGVGQKYTNTTDFTYYSVEPGVSMPVGPFTAKLGWRYRSATQLDSDQTHTARASLTYPLNKNDSVTVGFDRIRGDTENNVVKVSYTRNF